MPLPRRRTRPRLPAARTGSAEPAREVTLALVKYTSPVAAASLPRAINAETVLQAASPAYESARLLTVFGVGIDVDPRLRAAADRLPRRSACSSR